MSSQDIACFLSAAKMFGKFFVRVTESSEVDQTWDPGLCRCLGKILCSNAILRFEVAIVTHRVNEVIGRVDAFERCG